MISKPAWGIILFALLMMPRGSLPLGSFLMFVFGFLASGFTVINRAVTADVADEVRLEQGRERAGILLAFTTLVKLAAPAAIGEWIGTGGVRKALLVHLLVSRRRKNQSPPEVRDQPGRRQHLRLR